MSSCSGAGMPFARMAASRPGRVSSFAILELVVDDDDG